MITLLLVFLVIFWVFGYLSVPGLPPKKIVLFTFREKPVTLWDALIFLVIVWAIGMLPGPLQAIGGALIILWLLGAVGVINIVNFQAIVIFALIIGLLLHLLKVL